MTGGPAPGHSPSTRLDFARLDAEIRAKIASALPGLEAHLALAPRPRRPNWRPGHYPADARQAAALLLFYPVGADPHIVLTMRTDHLPQHGGQVSLPGGALDPGETIEAAALREAYEEAGIEHGLVSLIGRLTPVHIPVSGFVLHPVVGSTGRRPDLQPHAHEVARILEIAVGALREPAAVRRERRWRDGVEYDIPLFDLGGIQIWGATAMILAEFLHLLGDRPDPWREG